MAAMVDRVCNSCGAQFKARAADVNRGWALFCSKSCKAAKQAQGGHIFAKAGGQCEEDSEWCHPFSEDGLNP